jgi:mannose-6-phosphate isomerase-like protein (cupin superfamily)
VKLAEKLSSTENSGELDKAQFIGEIAREIEGADYTIVELNSEKPWGGYIRIDNDQADRFVETFFPNLSPEEARLGSGVELSPKILVVSPAQRLSWQYHFRRAENWVFLSPGAYHRSETDNQGERIEAAAGTMVQFNQGERHRLIGGDDNYTLVAEIWQHTDVNELSDEDDIVRLQDDYQRN